MRYYDSNTGTRFDKNHPLWPKTKAGKPYEKNPSQKVLDQIKGINLFPSVTSFVPCMTTGNDFDAGMRWVKSLVKGYSGADVIGYLDKKTVEQRELGTKCHEAVELYAEGKREGFDEVETKAIRAVQSVMDISGYSELQFCDAVLRYGGTADLVNLEYVTDYKFPSKARKCRITELLQIALYMKFFKRNGRLVVVNTETFQPKVRMIEYGSHEYKYLVRCGEHALSTWYMAKEITKLT